MKKYYLHIGAEQQGPFSFEELRTRNLNYDTPVWREGMSHWSVAGKIEELRGIIQEKPPVFNPRNSEKHAGTDSYNYLNSSKKKTSRVKWLWGIGTFAVIVTMLAYNGVRKNKELDKQNFLRYPEFYVSVHHNGFNYNKLFGGISNLKLTVVNNSKYFIDNARVIVSYIRKNGATYKEEFVDVNNIPASSEKIVDAPNSDAGMDIQLRLSSVTSVDARQR